MNLDGLVFLDELRKADAVFSRPVTLLCVELKLNVSRVSAAFKGEGELGKSTIQKIAEHCDCNPLYLRLRLVERQIKAEIEQQVDK